LPGLFLATVACMNHPAYWKFVPTESICFLLRPATHTIEPSSRAYTRRPAGPIMSTMVSGDTQWTVQIGGSASRFRSCWQATGDVNDRQGAARVRNGCNPPRHPQRRGDPGRRQVDPARTRVAVRVMPWRAERLVTVSARGRSARHGITHMNPARSRELAVGVQRDHVAGRSFRSIVAGV